MTRNPTQTTRCSCRGCPCVDSWARV